MSQKRTRGVAALVVGVTVACGVSGCAGASANSAAACARPVIELQESALRPGGVVQLSADFIRQTCEDTGGTSTAASDVTVTITPSESGEVLVLGRPAPKGERATVSGSFYLPTDLPLGPAVLAVRTDSGDWIVADLPIEITTPPTF